MLRSPRLDSSTRYCGTSTQQVSTHVPPHAGSVGLPQWASPGGHGFSSSGTMHDDRSNNMNSTSFSCGVVGPLEHSFGKVVPEFEEFETWKSLKTTRPHCMSGVAVIGVLNVR